MLEWLAMWGATEFIFRPIMEMLAKDAAKDWAKDIFKNSMKNVLKLPSKEYRKSAGKAIREFLALIQDELEGAGLSEEDIKAYIRPLKKFLKDQEVIQLLGSPFQPETDDLDVQALGRKWTDLDMPELPEDFRWRPVGKRYVKRVNDIVMASDVLRQIWMAVKSGETADAVKQIAGVSPDFDLEKYREGLLERYGNLNLESLDATGAYYELKLWRVFIPQTVRECREYLPQVYEMPKEVQARLKETGEMPDDLAEWELKRFQKAYQEQPVRSVLEAIEDPQNQYMVVLGDPGSGKSTLLQYLALEWARKPMREISLEPLPLLIELRTYARDCENGVCNDILSFCHNGNVCCRLNDLELKKQSDAGNVVALFDGLDEVFDPARREEVITAIHRFSNDYPNVRIIVTSRVVGYKPQKLKDAEFRHFMLQDLDEEQVEEFINKWHDLTFTVEWEKERKRDRLKQAIEDSSAIQQLAGNPLLLTMMAILNRNQELPRDRAELYHQCSRLLLHQWDIERHLVDKKLDVTAIGFKDKQAMLRRVAFFMQSSEKGLAGNLIYKDDLERILWDYLKEMDVREPRKVARLLIEQLRVRNFILCHVGADWYAFVHRTFLEYFCASAFVEKFGRRGMADGITPEEMKRDVFGGHWTDESWHEVLRLIAGMIEAEFVGQILEYLMERDGEEGMFANLFLAARCLNEVRNRNAIANVDFRLLNRQKELIRYDLPYSSYSLLDEKDQPVKDVRTKAVSTIVYVWKNTPTTIEWLKSRATQDENWAVRYTAVIELAREWKDDPDTLPWITNCATQDKDLSIRVAAIMMLARGWKDDPDTLPIIKSRATQDENEWVRQAAVQELARGWKDDPDTYNVLCKRAVNDPFERKYDWQENPRQTALEALVRHFPDRPRTRDILQDRAQNDPDKWVREYAAEALEKLNQDSQDDEGVSG